MVFTLNIFIEKNFSFNLAGKFILTFQEMTFLPVWPRRFYLNEFMIKNRILTIIFDSFLNLIFSPSPSIFTTY